MTNFAKPKKGRPPNDPVDAMRVRTWWFAIRMSDREGPRQIAERLIADDKNRYTGPDAAKNLTTQIRRYSNGSNIPAEALVTHVNKVYPGTRKWLELPLWSIIKQPNIDLQDLYLIMQKLHPTLVRRLFKTDKITGSAKRTKYPSHTQIYAIERMNTHDALACLLCLMRESDYYGYWIEHQQLNWSAYSLFIRLACYFPFQHAAPEMIKILYERFFNRVYPGNKVFPPLHGPPAPRGDIYIRIGEKEEMTAMAVEMGLISRKPEDELLFLFWMDLGPRYKIMDEIEHAWKTKTIPTDPNNSFATLLRKYKRNSRYELFVWH